MKKVFLPSLILLIVTLIIAVVPTEAEGEIYSDTIRLHILANSDSEHDQEIKLIIRDKLLQKYGNMLKSEDKIENAEKKAQALLPNMQGDVNSWLYELGCDYNAEISLSEEWYDTRVYENLTLPKGCYMSLRIIIGSGEGKNWWCVMYPPLCLDMATENAPADDGIINYTKEEINLISNKKYNIKFKLLEIISDIFN